MPRQKITPSHIENNECNSYSSHFVVGKPCQSWCIPVPINGLWFTPLHLISSISRFILIFRQCFNCRRWTSFLYLKCPYPVNKVALLYLQVTNSSNHAHFRGNPSSNYDERDRSDRPHRDSNRGPAGMPIWKSDVKTTELRLGAMKLCRILRPILHVHFRFVI